MGLSEHSYHHGQQFLQQQAINKDTEVRHLPCCEIQSLGNILANDWIQFMCSIPGPKAGHKRFDNKDVDLISQELTMSNKKTGFEILIDNWGTMEQWGYSGSTRRRPKVLDLLELCEKIGNNEAVSYVNYDILKNKTGLIPYPRGELKDEDDLLERTIEEESENNPFRPSKTSNKYLWAITNGFQHERFLGEGSFSKVFKGCTLKSKNLVAIKQLRYCKDEEVERKSKEMVHFEVDNLPLLKHQNIISLYGYSSDSTHSPCLIYPLMSNGTLKTMLKYGTDQEKHLNSGQRLEISKGISEGICFIHRPHATSAKGFIHRDIKSSNILLDKNLIPKIADFGLLRRAVSGENSDSTPTNLVEGSPAYMPPEARIDFDYKYSTKWDVWSFGVVLLEILTSLPAAELKIEQFPKKINIISYVNFYIHEHDEHGDGSLTQILDSCWQKENRLDIAKSILSVSKERCLVRIIKDRATSREVSQKLRLL